MSCHTHERKHKEASFSYVTICNDDLLYLVDHCYNVIGDEKLKSITDRILLSALGVQEL